MTEKLEKKNLFEKKQTALTDIKSEKKKMTEKLKKKELEKNFKSEQKKINILSLGSIS